jgi:8-oxo-dGTP pyrophosphatase MutT (NUDIX family)
MKKFRTETSAGGIVYKKDSDKTLWLLTQHSQHGHWSFPKGLIGDNIRNEKPQEAALREVKEEGGIEAKIIKDEPIDVHYMYQAQGYLIKKTVYYFLMEYISGDPKDHDWEVTDAQFITTEKVVEKLTFKNDKEAFEKALTSLRAE